MRPTKPCATCGATFEKNPRYSLSQWGRATFCSNKCRGTALATKTYPLCACGCGQQVRKGNARWRQGHNPHPERIKVWQVSTVRGKRRWWTTDRTGRRYAWARVVLWDEIGRELRPDEVAHHINGDSTDDRAENLRAFTSHSDHMRHEWASGRLQVLEPGRGSVAV